jgi:glycerol-3-phosphate acyltransferase PlsY
MEIILFIISYLIGAIPFGLVIGKMAGIDVREKGSGNIGATNVNRLLGKKLGILTLALDVCKGILPMVIAATVIGESAGKEVYISSCGILAVIGHMFPVYLRFKGGKGVATGLGVFLYLSPVMIAVSLVVFIVTVALTGFVSAGSLLASALAPLWLFLLGASNTKIIAAAVVAVCIWLKHHENIGRLLRGQEKSWKNK